MTTQVFVEIGTKRVFAGAIDWPGWCRSRRTEADAVTALEAYAPRYARVLAGRRLGFSVASATPLQVSERLEGDGTTDFGAPSIAPRVDARPMTEADLPRASAIMRACWAALDRAASEAEGLELAKGPRGGGRSLHAIVEHVLDADAAYVRKIAGRPPKTDPNDLDAASKDPRATILGALASAVRDGLPAHGPRGGALWTPRYFVRRSAWHVLDHAWEIEDRTEA